MSGDAPLLELTGVEKNFGAVRALRGVSFTLRRGEVHALVGENGAGKSTLIKLLAGTHQPDAGEVSIDGRVVRHLSPAEARRHGVACVFQQPALFPDLTVAENLALRLDAPGAWSRIRPTERRERARGLLGRVGASIDPDAEAGSLSMPEQQLVELAGALGAGAQAVILDEPTASLTRAEQDLLYEAVRGLRRAGAGVIYISHRLEEIIALADRVTVLRDGESIGSMPASEATEAKLIRMMVGRPVETLYPPSEAPPGEPVLEVRGLTCDEAGVADVSFTLRAGEILGLAGLVGAGRTELARTLFGLTPADRGEIRLGAHSVAIRSPGAAARLGVAYVPEDRRRHGVVGEMSVAENISLAVLGRIHKGGWLRRSAERELALEHIRALAIKTPGPDAPVSGLSGGNQQKTALARWLAVKPRVLILDEPTQGVDVGAKAEIHAGLRKLAASGLAILLISSDLPEVLGMSDRLLVMRRGRIVGEFPAGADAQDVMAAAIGGAGEAAA
jgi:rhamnose transport system ATP-binding protein